MKNVTKQFALAALVACASGASLAAWGQDDCTPRFGTVKPDSYGTFYGTMDPAWCGTVGDDHRGGPYTDPAPDSDTDVIQASWRVPVETVITLGQPSGYSAPPVDKPDCTVERGPDDGIIPCDITI